ncbi:hypothetical protein AAULR_16674 [Lacticaseibacillus rhamnosus MTCC 5462]|nr:hypothetical protein AAULR_16674 [Lacticaseibacillus rhamnosus MTCC 5462]
MSNVNEQTIYGLDLWAGGNAKVKPLKPFKQPRTVTLMLQPAI